MAFIPFLQTMSNTSSTAPPVSQDSASPSQQAASRSTTAASSSSNNIQQAQHGEDRLYKTWKTLANCFLVGQQKADRGNCTMQELEEYMVLFLRTRVEFGRIITYLEAKLEGTAQDMEAVQHYHRTMPKTATGTLISSSSLTNADPTEIVTNGTNTSDENQHKRKRDETDTAVAESDTIQHEAKRPAL